MHGASCGQTWKNRSGRHLTGIILTRLGPKGLTGKLCLHHFDSTGGFEVIDGMHLTPVDKFAVNRQLRFAQCAFPRNDLLIASSR